MFIKAREIINNKVINRSGCYLGRVIDFDVNTSTQSIQKYYVQGNVLGFFKEQLIIDVSQVIEIKKNKIIVEDTVIRKKITNKKTESTIEYAK